MFPPWTTFFLGSRWDLGGRSRERGLGCGDGYRLRRVLVLADAPATGLSAIFVQIPYTQSKDVHPFTAPLLPAISTRRLAASIAVI
jgi:hypothetical protein